MAKKQIAQATMTHSRTTKGALLYNNVKDGNTVTNIYLRKDSMPNPPPGEIQLTITVDAPDGE